jgi:hypothetical protein
VWYCFLFFRYILAIAFGEALLFEPGFGDLAPVNVAGLVVVHAAPARVFSMRRFR